VWEDIEQKTFLEMAVKIFESEVRLELAFKSPVPGQLQALKFQDDSDMSSADRQALPVLGYRVNKRSYKGNYRWVCLAHATVTLIVACGELLQFAGENGRCLYLQNGRTGYREGDRLADQRSDIGFA
jgi:hypothetical protein